MTYLRAGAGTVLLCVVYLFAARADHIGTVGWVALFGLCIFAAVNIGAGVYDSIDWDRDTSGLWLETRNGPRA